MEKIFQNAWSIKAIRYIFWMFSDVNQQRNSRMSQAMIVQTQFLSARYEIKNCVGTSALGARINVRKRRCLLYIISFI